MATLLVIDDDDSVRYAFRYVFQEEDVAVVTAATAEEGWEQLCRHHPDVVVLDLKLPDRSGLEVFKEIRAFDPRRPVIFITAHGSGDTALEAMKYGAFDYLIKPLDLERLGRIIARALEAARLLNAPAALQPDDTADRIIGHSPAVQEMCKAIGRVAPQNVNILIQGESGSGKELVARALYRHSQRADMPFLAINCAAIPETLLESELFGHEEGAFTGASRRRIGKFEQCDGGTLLLDEIGDMAPALQSKILRVLQDQCFERVGGNETLQTRVRVLAATNHDLVGLVEAGRFRKELYYRLKAVTIDVPPLRQRLDDVAELAHYFLFRFNPELDRDLRAIAPETLECLQQHTWPGNVRELQGVIKHAMLQASGHTLLPEFLPRDLRAAAAVSLPSETVQEAGLQALVEALLQRGRGDVYAEAVASLERILLPRVLRHTQGNQAQASEMLGISRGTLRQKLRSLGLAIEKVLADERSESN